MTDLKTITPANLSAIEQQALFNHILRRLTAYVNDHVSYVVTEGSYINPEAVMHLRKLLIKELTEWAQDLLNHAWAVCQEPGGGSCPRLDPRTNTSVSSLPPLPSQEQLSQTLSTILFLHITTSKFYSAHTRVFLTAFAPIDESAIVNTLKNPDDALKQAQTERAKANEASKGKTMRYVGMGLAGIAGGALIGVTGGLAAPLVGGAVSTVLGFFGVGGTVAGLLVSGLAGSSVVCGTLFGVYGARSSATIVQNHMREIRDLELVPVRPPKETLAVRVCVSGWLNDEIDVVEPWEVFGTNSDTYALRWEVEVLKELANAFKSLMKTTTLGYLQYEVLKHTALAALMSALSPLLVLKIGQIIDNPWRRARALALKAGTVLGKLLEERVYGARPITLTGYSLGALVIFEALRYLATISPAKSAHLVQDVFLFGLPVPSDAREWASIRRVVAGRLVNGYCEQDYVLAVLSRASDASWNVAGLASVNTHGVENIKCEGVDAHLKWRGHIGECLEHANVPDIAHDEVEEQIRLVGRPLDEEIDMDAKQAEKIVQNDEEAMFTRTP